MGENWEKFFEMCFKKTGTTHSEYGKVCALTFFFFFLTLICSQVFTLYSVFFCAVWIRPHWERKDGRGPARLFARVASQFPPLLQTMLPVTLHITVVACTTIRIYMYIYIFESNVTYSSVVSTCCLFCSFTKWTSFSQSRCCKCTLHVYRYKVLQGKKGLNSRHSNLTNIVHYALFLVAVFYSR